MSIKMILTPLVVISLTGCNLNTTVHNDEFDKMEAEKITSAFYRGVVTNDYSKIDTLFSPTQYKNQKRDSLGIFIGDIHKQFGTIVTWSLADWKTVDVKGTDAKTEYALVYNVEFSSKNVAETFIMRKEEGKVRIVDLQITE